jgi:hypothetical protein
MVRADERGSDLDFSLVADQLFSLIALPSYNPRKFGITGGLKRMICTIRALSQLAAVAFVCEVFFLVSYRILTTMIEVRQTEIFARWLANLRDGRARTRINARIRRLSVGNPGDAKSLGGCVRDAEITSNLLPSRLV